MERPLGETRSETVREERRNSDPDPKLGGPARGPSEDGSEGEHPDPAKADPRDLRRDADLKGGSTSG